MDQVEQAVVIVPRLVRVDDADRPVGPAIARDGYCLSHQVERGAPVGAAHIGQGERGRSIPVWQAMDRLKYERRRTVNRVLGTLGHGRIVPAASHRNVYSLHGALCHNACSPSKTVGFRNLTNQAERTRPASEASGSKILLKPIVLRSRVIKAAV